MRRPLIDDPLVQDSFIELDNLLKWLDKKRQQEPDYKALLIGGWAVYMYNPYYGSIDIDIITNNRIRHSIEQYLVTSRGFHRVKSPYQGSKWVVQEVPNGVIHIDIAAVGRSDSFEGTSLSLELASVFDDFIMFNAGDVFVPIPERGQLLVTKLKAAWDRSWRLEKGTSRDPEFEIRKLEKDFADIIALIDPSAGGQDIDIIKLGASLEQYNFLVGILNRIEQELGAIRFYNRLGQADVVSAVNNILRLTS